MTQDSNQLGIVVKLETESGRRDEVLDALCNLFGETSRHANFLEARVFKGLEPDVIMLVELWAETAESFKVRASTSDYFAAFEAEAGLAIRSREVILMDGDAVWSRMP
ncbi:antibiotic biosynthesis monooxygenase [Phyllobacterium chamaecytisi]|uniref:antibiotic biosynthesis monooxygenase n=1 Tax=Phyllobacterium chamaecytisi TaxID=2876082 RepID=UPI001CCD5FCA|nr:antibiotic biosynthesis monooxygenase [Phyllobacterium sp. KW56]MBZ9606020.1 antibiotic biosynthesis monooxygenase [Phyllobacterium sp. KW56]